MNKTTLMSILIFVQIIIILCSSCQIIDFGPPSDYHGTITGRIFWYNGNICFFRGYQVWINSYHETETRTLVINKLDPITRELALDTIDMGYEQYDIGKLTFSVNSNKVIFSTEFTNNFQLNLDKIGNINYWQHDINDTSLINKSLLCLSEDSSYVWYESECVKYYDSKEDTQYEFNFSPVEISVNWNISKCASISDEQLLLIDLNNNDTLRVDVSSAAYSAYNVSYLSKVRWKSDTIYIKAYAPDSDYRGKRLLLKISDKGILLSTEDGKYFNRNDEGSYIITHYFDELFETDKLKLSMYNGNDILIDSFIIDKKGELEQ